MFVGPHDSIDGGPAAIDPRLNRSQLIARSARGGSTACGRRACRRPASAGRASQLGPVDAYARGGGVRTPHAESRRHDRPRHRPRHRQHRLRRGRKRRLAPARARRRRDLDAAGRRARAAAGRDPRSGRRAARQPRARGGRDRGAVLRRQRAYRVRRRPGPRRRAAGRRPARRALPLLHAPAGQGGGLRQRPRRQGPGGADGRPAARPGDAPPSPDHAADALAVAICDLNRAPLARAVARA